MNKITNMKFLNSFKKSNSSINNSKKIVYLLIITYSFLFSIITCFLTYYTFSFCGYDLGIFDQSLWNTINNKKFFYNPLEGNNHFQSHFQPILLLILPFYFFYQSPVTLLIIQSIILGLGAFPIYLLSKDLTNKKIALIFALIYLCYPALHGLNSAEFHPISLSTTFLLFLFYFYQKEKIIPYFIFLILSLMTKEEVFLITFFLGIYEIINKIDFKMFKNRKVIKFKTIKFGLITIITSILWAFFTYQIIPILFSWNYSSHFGRWDHISQEKSLAKLILDIIKPKNLPKIFGILFSQSSFEYLISIFFPIIFLSILSPETLIICFPSIFANLTSNINHMRSIYTQYQATIIPFIFISAIYGAKKINHINRNKIVYLILILQVISMIFISPIPIAINNQPIGKKTLGRLPQFHDEIIRKTIDLIPQLNTSVSAQVNLYAYPKVSHRENSMIKLKKNVLPDFILFDIKNKPGATKDSYSINYLKDLVFKKEYGIYSATDGVYLLKKGYKNKEIKFPINQGLLAYFYEDPSMEQYSYQEIILEVNNEWKSKPFFLKNDNFSIVYEGEINIIKDDTYDLKIESNDNYQFFIDKKKIIDRWKHNEKDVTSFKIFLSKGKHLIRINYKKNSDNPKIKLYWKTQNNSYEIITRNYFTLPLKSSFNMNSSYNIS